MRYGASLDFEGLTRRVSLEEHVFPGVVGEGWSTERAEKAISENICEETENTNLPTM